MQFNNRIDHGFIDEASSLLSFRGSYVEAMSASKTKMCGKYQTIYIYIYIWFEIKVSCYTLARKKSLRIMNATTYV